MNTSKNADSSTDTNTTARSNDAPTITELLRAIGSGDTGAANALYAAVYADLHRMARHRLYDTGSLGVLDAPGLVSEAFLKISGKEGDLSENRGMFFGYAAKVMRSIILDRVREMQAQKRGDGLAEVTLHTGLADVTVPEDRFEALEQALQRLERIDERASRLVEMRFFAGMSMAECAQQLSISTATTARLWERARGFLAETLGDSRGGVA